MMEILFWFYFHNLRYPISDIFFISLHSSIRIRHPSICLSLSSDSRSIWKLETVGRTSDSNSDVTIIFNTHVLNFIYS